MQDGYNVQGVFMKSIYQYATDRFVNFKTEVKMKSFKEMSKEELLEQKAQLEKRVEEFKAMNLSLNMTRGKPAPNQLSMSDDMYTAS